MCGRAAQTGDTVNTAAREFSTAFQYEASGKLSPSSKGNLPLDNFNISPGMDCDIMLVQENGDFLVERKKWGLITQNGSSKKTLYTNNRELIKLCFESLCFNARSETLYSKPKFSKLVHKGRTCIVAVDGYFEWMSHPIPKMNKAKQPYFIYRNQKLGSSAEMQQQKREPLLIAGIWTSVPTGIAQAPELGSFAMLTIDASDQIKWLHHRMPVCIWDMELAKQWLTKPSEELKRMLDDAARCKTDGFSWHKVTPEMSKLSFRSKKSIMELKETTPSVMQFFADGRPLSNKTGKKVMVNSSFGNHTTSESSGKIKKITNAKSMTTVHGQLKGRISTLKRYGKRSNPSHSTFLRKAKQHNKKSKSNQSPAVRSEKQVSEKQVLIDHFFLKQKK